MVLGHRLHLKVHKKVLTTVPAKQPQKNQITSFTHRKLFDETSYNENSNPKPQSMDQRTSGVVPVPTLEPVDGTNARTSWSNSDRKTKTLKTNQQTTATTAPFGSNQPNKEASKASSVPSDMSHRYNIHEFTGTVNALATVLSSRESSWTTVFNFILKNVWLL